MFKSARIKLTGWYLLIIMLISILFSLSIYSQVNSEFNRVERLQELRRERDLQFVPAPPPPNPTLDANFVQESRNRIGIILIFINFGILIISGGAAYFLAGRTLKPIKKMVDEQNRFITDASHELRTPLTSLRTELEVNLRDNNLNLKDAKKLLESNLEDVVSLQILSNNLMGLSQYDNGKINREKVSMLEVTNEAIKKITPMAKNKNITIKNNTEDLKIPGNKERLRELFVILLDNAVKYSGKNKKITITSAKNNKIVNVNVKDRGIGISHDELSNVFKRFYRIEKSRSKSTSGGYGLGLSIAAKIVRMHNGKISAESELGKGSTFSVQLPTKV